MPTVNVTEDGKFIVAHSGEAHGILTLGDLESATRVLLVEGIPDDAKVIISTIDGAITLSARTALEDRTEQLRAIRKRVLDHQLSTNRYSPTMLLEDLLEVLEGV